MLGIQTPGFFDYKVLAVFTVQPPLQKSPIQTRAKAIVQRSSHFQSVDIDILALENYSLMVYLITLFSAYLQDSSLTF